MTWVVPYLPDDAPGFLGKLSIYTMAEQLSQSPFPFPHSSSPPPNFHDNLLIHLHPLCFSASAASETNSSNNNPPPSSIFPTVPSLQVRTFCSLIFPRFTSCSINKRDYSTLVIKYLTLQLRRTEPDLIIEALDFGDFQAQEPATVLCSLILGSASLSTAVLRRSRRKRFDLGVYAGKKLENSGRKKVVR